MKVHKRPSESTIKKLMSSLFNHIIEVIVDGRFRMDNLGFIFVSLDNIQTAWMHRRIDMLHLNCLFVLNLSKHLS